MTAASDIARALGKPERVGKRWRCLCPAHDDSKPSLDIDEPSPGRLLFVCRAGCDNRDIMAALTARGLWPLQGVASSRSDRPRHGEWGDPAEVYTYTDGDGAPVGVVCRWDAPPGQTFPDGRAKQIMPFVRDGDRWKAKGLPEPRPLYGIRALAKDGTLTQAEAEARDARRRMGLHRGPPRGV